jgi:enediyne biosynthesis protein E4
MNRLLTTTIFFTIKKLSFIKQQKGMKLNFLMVTVLFIIVSCSKKEQKLFEKLDSDDTNIQFVNQLDEKKDISILDYLYYYNGGGVSLGDINNDGLADMYFTSNQGKNKLYLNKGNNKYEDISVKAAVEGESDWNTGTVMADVNGDGFLDIYVCAVVGIHGFEGHNELFINNKNNTFTESAAQYGLDLDNYSSSAAFFDYDLDGDLDMYLLNHAVHSELSYGNADIRNKRSYECGDKLFRNDNNKFIDVSEKAGIYGGLNGYGLGLAVSDFNLDSYPDLYIGNDFHEDDYYYLNNGDGTFTESMKKYFGHTSRFSMGVDASDINHDGYPDLMTLDMLPENEKVLKSSLGDDNIQMFKLRTEKLGYNPQYTRNMLQINQAGKNFSECALMSGVAATDWSWSALFADYDQDGEQDIFISNGIPKRPNDLDYVKYYSTDEVKSKLNSTKLLDKEALKKMPSGKVSNAVFKGKADLNFDNKSSFWIENDSIISNGSAYADLDNDGDLDLVTNNLNEKATLYSNQTNATSNYLKLKLAFEGKNKFGIGTKVFAYSKETLQSKELQTTRGFQSSSEPIIHFGVNKQIAIDSLVVIWPDRTAQTIKNVKANQTLTVKAAPNRKPFNYNQLHPKTIPLFQKEDSNLGINFTHRDNDFIDFLYQKLIPYQHSDRNPAVAVGDLNNDGLEDIFFGGGKEIPAEMYLQTANGFSKKTNLEIEKSRPAIDAAAVIADFNLDKSNDIFVASGGGQLSNDLQSRLYFGGSWKASALPKIAQNAAVVKTFDYDNDGDLDLFVGNNSMNNKFGSMPDCYLLNNNKGVFSIVQNKTFAAIGMVTDAVFSDFNKDGQTDIIAVGEWMQPTFFENKKGNFKNVTAALVPQKNKGLWQAIQPFDIDHDGDLDYLLGNWGLNSKFTATGDFPMKMYYDDFDRNYTFETIVAVEKGGNYYTTVGLEELSEEFSGVLKKKFNSYSSFAGKRLEDIFEASWLKNAALYEVHNLKSGYLKNEKGIFTFVPFSNKLQVAPINCFAKWDFDGDKKEDVFAAGNYFGVTPYHSKFDGFSGALIKSEKNILLGHQIGIDLTNKAVRHLDVINFKGANYLLVSINKMKLEVYKIN